MQMLHRRIGEYYLVSQIGAGGMSQVYLGQNPRNQEQRAVKILAKRGTMLPTAYARFLREVDIIRGFSHPRIVKVLESGALEDCYYYMMEYFAGGSLAQRISHARFSPAAAVDIFVQICEAMTHAHDRGIIHRDLKPANVLLDSAGDAYVSDFGIAKVLNRGAEALTRSDEIIGTIAYLAPEQRHSAKRVDRRADVYALGAILYEMIMGFPPLGKFPWPGETRASFPAELQAILEKCLAILPDDRFAHAGFLLLDLKKLRNTDEHLAASSLPEAGAKEERMLFNVKAGGCHGESDHIEVWLGTLRLGTTRERLAVVREMVNKMDAREASAILKMYQGEGDRVRWGLIRALGQLRVKAAVPLILQELKSPFHRECAIEALGNIGSEEAFDPIREFLSKNPESASIALLPLARTGKRRAMKHLQRYLSVDLAVVRQAAIRAIASIECPECLGILKTHASVERDDKVRSFLQQSLKSLEAALRSKDTLIESNPS
jgi:serine/threonine protein kinase